LVTFIYDIEKDTCLDLAYSFFENYLDLYSCLFVTDLDEFSIKIGRSRALQENAVDSFEEELSPAVDYGSYRNPYNCQNESLHP